MFGGVSRLKMLTAISKFTLKLFFQFFFIFFVFQRTFFSNIPFSGHLGLSKKRGQLWVSNSFPLWRYNPWNIVQKSISAYLFSIKGYHIYICKNGILSNQNYAVISTHKKLFKTPNPLHLTQNYYRDPNSRWSIFCY